MLIKRTPPPTTIIELNNLLSKIKSSENVFNIFPNLPSPIKYDYGSLGYSTYLNGNPHLLTYLIKDQKNTTLMVLKKYYLKEYN